MSEEINNLTESQTEVQKNSETPETQANQNVLFGTIGYADDTAYENFIQNMNLSQAVFVLVASANFAQAKGAFNLLESESLSSAIRVIRKNSSETKAEENGSNN
jgi:hypothetical protein